MADDWTSVSVREETRDALRALKHGNETYDDVIGRLLEEVDIGKVADRILDEWEETHGG